jgi:diguanylate cyclase (GGDEF)-like protein
MPTPAQRPTAAQRLARQAWNLLHVDSARARALADRACDAAAAVGDPLAEGWGRLARGVHLLYYGSATDAATELRHAGRCFDVVGNRAGQILVAAGVARSLWRQGHFDEALAQVLPLRDEGLRVLRHEQRGVLLNTIAGCFSARGDSTQAFAYMFEALRDAGPGHGRGFDTVLHCNLSHELLQIGDHEQALRHVDEGLVRCAALSNPRLRSVLSINRVICLTGLDRAADTLPEIHRLLELPADDLGRGRMSAHFETMSIAALRAGDAALGATLLEQARALGPPALPDDRLERAVAEALLALAQRRAHAALKALAPLQSQADDDAVNGQSLRLRLLYLEVLSEAHDADGRPIAALAALRQGQRLLRAQAQIASRARYQAAALHTELLRLQQRLDAKDAERRAATRARDQLVAANEQLSRRIAEVQSLQQALREQATHDPLTGLFNRRHLNDTLPTLCALAEREGRPLALAIIDLDHFKQVNDRHGHAAGDRLLASFGALLDRHRRRSDVACRYGGEEFCVLLPRTDAAGARRSLVALLRRWRETVHTIGDAEVAGLSFSAGVADTHETPGSADALLKAADDRLLAAKRRGRGRVDSAATA